MDREEASKIIHDLIISTHPFATQMCAMLKEKEKIEQDIEEIENGKNKERYNDENFNSFKR